MRGSDFLLMGEFEGSGAFRDFLSFTFPQADDTLEKNNWRCAMKKFISIILLLLIVLSLSTTAFAAAPQDLVYEKDTTLKASFVKYGNITVKSGVTLTIDKNSGFEIAGNITVEEGAKIICNGEGPGMFNFCMIGKDSSITGMDIYYKYKGESGTEVRRVSGGYAAVAALDWDWGNGWSPSFAWDESVQGWCLTMETNVNLSDEPVYHTERDMNTATQFADRLKTLRLFRGSDKGYELSREGSRLEALVMLIRLLGQEEVALSGTWKHPFTDVPAWADKYVGYAYETGLTAGVSATQFGTGTASAQMYFTFVLRALGETDTEDYTVYDHAFELMGASGILSTENDSYEICTRSFWRADMVVVSYRALSAKTASGEMLWERLVEAGVFTADELNAAA